MPDPQEEVHGSQSPQSWIWREVDLIGSRTRAGQWRETRKMNRGVYRQDCWSQPRQFQWKYTERNRKARNGDKPAFSAWKVQSTGQGFSVQGCICFKSPAAQASSHQIQAASGGNSIQASRNMVGLEWDSHFMGYNCPHYIKGSIT